MSAPISVSLNPRVRAEQIDWARGVISDLPYHADATVAHACEVLLTLSTDHCDHERARQLRRAMTRDETNGGPNRQVPAPWSSLRGAGTNQSGEPEPNGASKIIAWLFISLAIEVIAIAAYISTKL